MDPIIWEYELNHTIPLSERLIASVHLWKVKKLQPQNNLPTSLASPKRQLPQPYSPQGTFADHKSSTHTQALRHFLCFLHPNTMKGNTHALAQLNSDSLVSKSSDSGRG